MPLRGAGFFPFYSLLSHSKNGEALDSGKDRRHFCVILKAPPGSQRLAVGRILVSGDDKMI